MAQQPYAQKTKQVLIAFVIVMIWFWAISQFLDSLYQ